MNVHESIITPKESLLTATYGGILRYKDNQIVTVRCSQCGREKNTRLGWHLRARWNERGLLYKCNTCTRLKWNAAGHSFLKGKVSKLKGKTYEEIFGTEGAAVKRSKLGRKGPLNNQFGKPAYNGSGNGWSGWYKGKYFRSLLELSFVVNYIEANNFEVITAETKKYCIPYINPVGTHRNYFPDYIINDMLIEIKPKNAILWESNQCKFKAAKKWCAERGLKFEVFDQTKFKQLSVEQLKILMSDGILKWLDRYDKKFTQKYGH